MKSDRKAGAIVSLLGDFAMGLGSVLGGEGSLALLGVGALARKIGKLVDGGESVDEILARLTPLPRLVKPWQVPETEHDTARETPSSKKDPA